MPLFSQTQLLLFKKGQRRWNINLVNAVLHTKELFFEWCFPKHFQQHRPAPPEEPLLQLNRFSLTKQASMQWRQAAKEGLWKKLNFTGKQQRRERGREMREEAICLGESSELTL